MMFVWLTMFMQRTPVSFDTANILKELLQYNEIAQVQNRTAKLAANGLIPVHWTICGIVSTEDCQTSQRWSTFTSYSSTSLLSNDIIR
jgi:hypothetical protein